MKPEEKVWKKLAKKELILSDYVREKISTAPTPESQSDQVREIIADLQDKLDAEYTVTDISTSTDAVTFEPVVRVIIRKTRK